MLLIKDLSFRYIIFVRKGFIIIIIEFYYEILWGLILWLKNVKYRSVEIFIFLLRFFRL